MDRWKNRIAVFEIGQLRYPTALDQARKEKGCRCVGRNSSGDNNAGAAPRAGETGKQLGEQAGQSGEGIGDNSVKC